MYSNLVVKIMDLLTLFLKMLSAPSLLYSRTLRVVVRFVAIVSVSFVNIFLAQSTKLCVFEERVLMIVEATRDLPGTLAATGGVAPPYSSNRCISQNVCVQSLAAFVWLNFTIHFAQYIALSQIYIELFTDKYVIGSQ